MLTDRICDLHEPLEVNAVLKFRTELTHEILEVVRDPLYILDRCH